MSTIVTPVFQLELLLILALSEMSSNLKLPLFKYSLFLFWLEAKYRSTNPSLLMSPAATPLPL